MTTLWIKKTITSNNYLEFLKEKLLSNESMGILDISAFYNRISHH